VQIQIFSEGNTPDPAKREGGVGGKERMKEWRREKDWGGKGERGNGREGKGRREGWEGREGKCRKGRGGEGRGGEGMRRGRWVGGVVLHALRGDRRH
jgi:hypothetical protein